MNCTTALTKMANGDLVRRKTWREGEYLHKTFDYDEQKNKIEKVNIKGEPTSEGKYITMDDMDAEDWEIYHTTCKIGNLTFIRTIDNIDFSVDNVITITKRIGNKQYETKLSCFDVEKLLNFFKDVVDAKKDTNLFRNAENVDWWGDENE